MKKWISLLLVCCMLLSVLPMTAAAADQFSADTSELPFSDVVGSSWAYDSISFVYREGLMLGTADKTFAPDTTLSRAMLVAIMHRAEGSPAPTTTPSFKDVKAGAWYTDAIAWAAENRIVLGYSQYAFGPDDLLTREQMVTILYRYANYAGKDTSDRADLTAFPDGSDTSSWALTAMQWAVAKELINGKGDGKLDPQGTATREEVAAVMARFYEHINTPATPTEEEIYAGALAAYKEACDFYYRWVIDKGWDSTRTWGDTIETYEQGTLSWDKVESGMHLPAASTDITTLQQLKESLALRFTQDFADECLEIIDPIEKDGKLYTEYVYYNHWAWVGPDTIERIENVGNNTYEMTVSGWDIGGELSGKIGFTYTNGLYQFYPIDTDGLTLFFLADPDNITLPQ